MAPFAITSFVGAQNPPAAGTITIGPNVQVSSDGNVGHVETSLVADPLDPQHLVGSAITFTSSNIGTATEAYASFDGGWSWIPAGIPRGQRSGAFDPVTAIGPGRIAYHLAAEYAEAAGGRGNDGGDYLAMYRSEDGGRTWVGPVKFGGPDYDRNAIVVDNSRGPYRGRVYVLSHNRDGVMLYRSADRGQTFVGPTTLGCGGGEYALVLSDGTLWIPCNPLDPAIVRQVGQSAAAISRDGGESFGLEPMSADAPPPINYVPPIAVDTSVRFRDRLYIAAQQALDGNHPTARRNRQPTVRVIIRFSDDRGRTWSVPRAVAPPHGSRNTQYLTGLAVNKDGVVGVMWSETSEPDFDDPAFARSRRDFRSHVYFTASVDGGVSFLPARRVSAAESRPANAANRAITQVKPSVSSDVTYFFTAYARWRNGGDYVGLAADADGVFHPFWPDARRGAFQVYTSRVAVTREPNRQQPAGARSSTADYEGRIEAMFGPPVSPHSGSSQDTILARLRNVSRDTLWGPFRAHVTLIGVDGVTPLSASRRGPEIFDSAVGRWALSADVDYASAMRDLPYLAPGATTEAVPWLLRRASLDQLQLRVKVRIGPQTRPFQPTVASMRKRRPRGGRAP